MVKRKSRRNSKNYRKTKRVSRKMRSNKRINRKSNKRIKRRTNKRTKRTNRKSYRIMKRQTMNKRMKRMKRRTKRLVNNIADQRILYGGVGNHSSFKVDWQRVVYVLKNEDKHISKLTLKLNKDGSACWGTEGHPRILTKITPETKNTHTLHYISSKDGTEKKEEGYIFCLSEEEIDSLKHSVSTSGKFVNDLLKDIFSAFENGIHEVLACSPGSEFHGLWKIIRASDSKNFERFCSRFLLGKILLSNGIDKIPLIDFDLRKIFFSGQKVRADLPISEFGDELVSLSAVLKNVSTDGVIFDTEEKQGNMTLLTVMDDVAMDEGSWGKYRVNMDRFCRLCVAQPVPVSKNNDKFLHEITDPHYNETPGDFWYPPCATLIKGLTRIVKILQKEKSEIDITSTQIATYKREHSQQNPEIELQTQALDLLESGGGTIYIANPNILDPTPEEIAQGHIRFKEGSVIIVTSEDEDEEFLHGFVVWGYYFYNDMINKNPAVFPNRQFRGKEIVQGKIGLIPKSKVSRLSMGGGSLIKEGGSLATQPSYEDDFYKEISQFLSELTKVFVQEETLSVKCPKGVNPGDVITHEYDGEELEITIPDGVHPGDEFEVNVDDPFISDVKYELTGIDHNECQNYKELHKKLIEQLLSMRAEKTELEEELQTLKTTAESVDHLNAGYEQLLKNTFILGKGKVDSFISEAEAEAAREAAREAAKAKARIDFEKARKAAEEEAARKAAERAEKLEEGKKKLKKAREAAEEEAARAAAALAPSETLSTEQMYDEVFKVSSAPDTPPDSPQTPLPTPPSTPRTDPSKERMKRLEKIQKEQEARRKEKKWIESRDKGNATRVAFGRHSTTNKAEIRDNFKNLY